MSRRLDDTRRGSRFCTDEERERVKQTMRQNHYDAAHATTTADLSRVMGIEGRTIRACFEQDDGVEYLLAGGDDGIYLAEYREEGESMTARLEAHARSELHRAERRRAYGDDLPRRQGQLW